MRVRLLNTFEPVTSLYRDLFPALVAAGDEVEVYVSKTEYRAGREFLEEVLPPEGVRVVRLPGAGRVASSRLQKLVSASLFAVFAGLRSLCGRPVDVNIFLTQPPLFAIWGSVLKLIRGTPYRCLLMDLYPDVVVESGMLSRSSMLTRLLRRLSRHSWRHARSVIVIGRCMRDYVVAAGIPEERVHVVANWSNEQLIVPVPHQENLLRSELGLAIDDFVVLYSGNMGTAHLFDDILAAAAALRDLPDLKFVFFGGGTRRREIEQSVNAKGLENVLLLPSQPERRLCLSQSLGDLHFISLRDPFTGLMVPSKAYGALAAGRPILYQGRADGEIARLIEEHGLGTVVPAEDSEAVVTAIRAYYADRDRARREGLKARQIAETKASMRHAIEGYLEVIRDGLAPGQRLMSSSG